MSWRGTDIEVLCSHFLWPTQFPVHVVSLIVIQMDRRPKSLPITCLMIHGIWISTVFGLSVLVNFVTSMHAINRACCSGHAEPCHFELMLFDLCQFVAMNPVLLLFRSRHDGSLSGALAHFATVIRRVAPCPRLSFRQLS